MTQEETTQEAVDVTVSELTPQSKRVNLTTRVIAKSEARDIPNRFGPANRVAEATVGDSSGTVIMSLWNDQIDTVEEGDTIQVLNGYVSLLRGHIRLNVGKYGRIVMADDEVTDVDEDVNLSDEEHEQPERRRGGRGGGGGDFRSGRGGRDRDRF